MNKPVLLIVDDDPQVLAAVRRDLRSRYREHYTVMSAASGEEALATARELKTRGDSLAIIISDQRMPGMPGSEVLARSRELYPLARRVLLTAYSDIEAAVKAINEAHLDHYLSKPWVPPEERLFPVIDDLLDAWQAEYLPEAKGLRLVGDQWSARSHAIKDFLASNLIPYRWLDVMRDPDARALLEAAGVCADELPALFFDDGSPVLRNPEPREVAERLGRPLCAAFEVYDLVIVGAGPAGLAAAVYGASEGLRTLLLDRHAPGGQAGSSSRIENYLGFPAGVSGSDLTRRALMQAQRLGAEFLAPLEVTGISIDAGYKRLKLADGRELVTRAMLAATGMFYREHPAPGVAEFTGAGVYYGAATAEAPAISGRRVLVAGGGNSAGQGAMYLARHAKEVQIVVRRDGLRDTMSSYLIDQIAKTPNIRLRLRTQIERVEGEGHVQRVALASLDDGICRVEEADALFVFIGTHPRSDWLPPEVLRDAKGFVLTGRDVMTADGYARIWKERREPLPLETSVPGVFAAGDLRAGAMNRVASAVGEGSMAVRLAHDYLALT
jgi:thioredoxin reductase (NADPH)